MGSQCISNLAWWRPPSAYVSCTILAPKCISQFNLVSASKCISELLDLGLQLHLQTSLSTASMCISEFNLSWASKFISKLAQSRPPSAYLGYTIPTYKCTSNLTWSRPPSAYLCSTGFRSPSASLRDLTSASKCNSKPGRSPPPSASPSSTWSRPPSASLNCSISAFKCISNPPDHGLHVYLWVQLDLRFQVHLQTSSDPATKYISQFTRTRPSTASLSSLNRSLHVLLQSRSSTVCSQIGRMCIYRET